MSSQLRQFTSNSSKVLQESSKLEAQKYTELAKQSEGALHQIEQSHRDLTEQLNIHKEQVNTFINNSVKEHDVFRKDCSEFFASLKEDKPTGSTPIKKKRELPAKIPSPLHYIPKKQYNKENVLQLLNIQ